MTLATFIPGQSEALDRQAQLALKEGGFYTGSVDGKFGPLSREALARWKAVQPIACKASSFADPADIVAFRKCKATSKSDLECFRVGDNGIGQWGANTAQEETPMVAVHGDILKARWGSVNAGAHKHVSITVGHVTITAAVEDRISERGRIDLNPACAKRLKLKPPFVVDCTWNWV